jgi:hypothetical protein
VQQRKKNDVTSILRRKEISNWRQQLEENDSHVFSQKLELGRQLRNKNSNCIKLKISEEFKGDIS